MMFMMNVTKAPHVRAEEQNRHGQLPVYYTRRLSVCIYTCICVYTCVNISIQTTRTSAEAAAFETAAMFVFVAVKSASCRVEANEAKENSKLRRFPRGQVSPALVHSFIYRESLSSVSDRV